MPDLRRSPSLRTLDRQRSTSIFRNALLHNFLSNLQLVERARHNTMPTPLRRSKTSSTKGNYSSAASDFRPSTNGNVHNATSTNCTNVARCICHFANKSSPQGSHVPHLIRRSCSYSDPTSSARHETPQNLLRRSSFPAIAKNNPREQEQMKNVEFLMRLRDPQYIADRQRTLNEQYLKLVDKSRDLSGRLVFKADGACKQENLTPFRSILMFLQWITVPSWPHA